MSTRENSPSISGYLDQSDTPSPLLSPLLGGPDAGIHVRQSAPHEDDATGFEPLDSDLIDLDSQPDYSENDVEEVKRPSGVDQKLLNNSPGADEGWIDEGGPVLALSGGPLTVEDWEVVGLYCKLQDDVTVLGSSSKSLLDSVVKLARQGYSSSRSIARENRILRSIAEVDSYLRTARSALLRGEPLPTRTDDVPRAVRELRTKSTASRAKLKRHDRRPTVRSPSMSGLGTSVSEAPVSVPHERSPRPPAVYPCQPSGAIATAHSPKGKRRAATSAPMISSATLRASASTPEAATSASVALQAPVRVPDAPLALAVASGDASSAVTTAPSLPSAGTEPAVIPAAPIAAPDATKTAPDATKSALGPGRFAMLFHRISHMYNLTVDGLYLLMEYSWRCLIAVIATLYSRRAIIPLTVLVLAALVMWEATYLLSPPGTVQGTGRPLWERARSRGVNLPQAPHPVIFHMTPWKSDDVLRVHRSVDYQAPRASRVSSELWGSIEDVSPLPVLRPPSLRDYLLARPIFMPVYARGIEQPGSIQSARIKQAHEGSDRLRRVAEETRAKNQTNIENTLLLATLGAPDNPHKTGLPERPTLRPSGPQERPSETPATPAPAPSARSKDGSDGSDDRLQNPPGPSQASAQDERQTRIRERLSLISILQSGLDLRSRTVSNDIELVFKPVTEFCDAPGELEECGGQNTSFTAYRDWLAQTLAENTGAPLLEDKQADNSFLGLLGLLKKEQRRLREIESRLWRKKMWAQFVVADSDSEVEGLPAIAAPSNVFTDRRALEPFLLAGLLMVTVLHTLSGVGFPASQYVLATLRAVIFGAITFNRVRSTGSDSRSGLSAFENALVKRVPLDLRTAIDVLKLSPDIVSHACCPKCFATYKPDESNPDDPFPRKCTRLTDEDTRCNKRLVRAQVIKAKKKGDPSRTIYIPVKTFVYRTFKSWLADLLGRPGIEAAILESWARQADASKCADIMDSPSIRQFVGPDGRTLFSVQTDGSVHLVLSLFVDWFNPFGNKKAGKSHSIGAIYLACLNLPPHLRYRPENVYLAGIIPGPKEPSLDQLNELLRPLVDELLELWNPGVYLLKTAMRPAGRVVRAALVPLVCDLPALRKTAGFASHSARNFCSFCPLTLDHINNVDRSTWPKPRTWSEHLDAAQEWKEATTEASRNRIFSQHGIRWSELLRLPYWDPTRYAVLDVMHNLFLGEVHHHCRSVWGMDVAQDKQPAPVKVAKHTPEEQQKMLDKVLAGVLAGSEKRLVNIRSDYLSTVARFNNAIGRTSSELTRSQLASALLAWAEQNGAAALRLPPVFNEPVARFRLAVDEAPPETSKYDIFTRDVLEQVRADIAATVLPSWIEKPPSNFGTAAHGKLKADHWRTVATVSLVITLTRLWGSIGATTEEQQVLENFVHLVCAVSLASRRSMTSSRAASYDQHMEAYLRGLRDLYNHKLVPNHHLSLHLRPLLEIFGPVHGWWAFPFERYNGILQRMNTNSKTEDMPATFMRCWYIGANLRWLMRTTEWPDEPVYSDMIHMFETAFRDRVQGTRVTDILNIFNAHDSPTFVYDRRREVRLSESVYEQLLQLLDSRRPGQFQSVSSGATSGLPRLSPFGQPVPSIEHNGVRFSTSDAGMRDSYITFRIRPDTVLAGQISEIIYHQRAENGDLFLEPFLVVKTFLPLVDKHASLDPYRRFPDLDAHLVYNTFDAQPRVVSLDQVVSHFAFYKYEPAGIGRECAVVRSLDRS